MLIGQHTRIWYLSNRLTVMPQMNLHIQAASPEPGRIAQSVTCLATDAILTADPGVTRSIPA